jgi:hypothetical protein
VFHFNGPGDQFFAELAFPFARQRYSCAESLIGAGFGGTVIGSLARSLFADGLRWMWIGAAPSERLITLLGSMMEERNRICMALENSDASCPILPRWFAPVTEVTNMTGASTAWLQAPAIPDEQKLLDQFLAKPIAPRNVSLGLSNTTPRELLASAEQLLGIAGLQGAVLVLAHAGHGNLLGLQSCLTKDGVAGHDLRADHEALFMQVAAVGVILTLLGVCIAIPESWPEEVEEESFLEEAIRLTQDVVSAATVIHGLGPIRRPTNAARKRRDSSPKTTPLLHPNAVLDVEGLLPDVNTADHVIARAEEYDSFATSWQLNPWKQSSNNLGAILVYSGSHSLLQTVMTTYDRPGSEVIAVFAARMLLEEAARFHWMTFDPSEQVVTERAKIYFDEYRYRRQKAIKAFAGNGVTQRNAEKLLALPDNIVAPASQHVVPLGRKPLPPITEMLRNLSKDYPEIGWMEVAYSLLSQVTHSTPIGHLHMIRVRGGEFQSCVITPELLGLTLDAACLGSAHLLGSSSVLLTHGNQEATKYARELRKRAYRVHDTARFTHGLD